MVGEWSSLIGQLIFSLLLSVYAIMGVGELGRKFNTDFLKIRYRQVVIKDKPKEKVKKTKDQLNEEMKQDMKERGIPCMSEDPHLTKTIFERISAPFRPAKVVEAPKTIKWKGEDSDSSQSIRKSQSRSDVAQRVVKKAGGPSTKTEDGKDVTPQRVSGERDSAKRDGSEKKRTEHSAESCERSTKKRDRKRETTTKETTDSEDTKTRESEVDKSAKRKEALELAVQREKEIQKAKEAEKNVFNKLGSLFKGSTPATTTTTTTEKTTESSKSSKRKEKSKSREKKDKSDISTKSTKSRKVAKSPNTSGKRREKEVKDKKKSERSKKGEKKSSTESTKRRKKSSGTEKIEKTTVLFEIEGKAREKTEKTETVDKVERSVEKEKKSKEIVAKEKAEKQKEAAKARDIETVEKVEKTEQPKEEMKKGSGEKTESVTAESVTADSVTTESVTKEGTEKTYEARDNIKKTDAEKETVVSVEGVMSDEEKKKEEKKNTEEKEEEGKKGEGRDASSPSPFGYDFLPTASGVQRSATRLMVVVQAAMENKQAKEQAFDTLDPMEDAIPTSELPPAALATDKYQLEKAKKEIEGDVSSKMLESAVEILRLSHKEKALEKAMNEKENEVLAKFFGGMLAYNDKIMELIGRALDKVYEYAVRRNPALPDPHFFDNRIMANKAIFDALIANPQYLPSSWKTRFQKWKEDADRERYGINMWRILFSYPKQRGFNDSPVREDGSFTPAPRNLFWGLLLGPSDKKTFEETAAEEAAKGFYLGCTLTEGAMLAKTPVTSSMSNQSVVEVKKEAAGGSGQTVTDGQNTVEAKKEATGEEKMIIGQKS